MEQRSKLVFDTRLGVLQNQQRVLENIALKMMASCRVMLDTAHGLNLWEHVRQQPDSLHHSNTLMELADFHQLD